MSAEETKLIAQRMFSQWAEDRKKGRGLAYTNLQQALAKHATDLVPDYMQMDRLIEKLAFLEPLTGADKQSESGDPLEGMAKWLRGDLDLSRIPLEVARKM